MWDDTDMEHLGLNKFALDESLQVKDEPEIPPPTRRAICLWVEKWEKPLLNKNDPESHAKLLEKYGGMVFMEEDELFTISSETIKFYKGKNCLVAKKNNYDPDDKETFEWMEINKDLFGLFHDYIRRGNENVADVKLQALPEDVDANTEWIGWLPNSPKKTKKRKPQEASPEAKKAKKTKSQQSPPAKSSPRKSPRKKTQKKGNK